MKKGPLVTVIVVNYNVPLETLRICLDSLENQTHQPMEILVIDNRSTNEAVEKAKVLYPKIQFLELKKNHGFAEGVNRGVERAKGEFLFIFNNDAQADPRAVEELLLVIQKSKELVGVSPKMMFYDKRRVFDSIGTLIDQYGAAFNMGVGQIDIGQYDLEERVFGACFGAALLRKSAFDPKNVGPLDKSYFMYYEDVDWCFRANLLGYKFLTAPKALVYHLHSASTKKKFVFSQKYYFIERNLLRTVVKDFERKRALKICLRRLAAHLRNILRGRFQRTSIRVIFRFFTDLPWYLTKRRTIQRRRKVPDLDIIKYSFGEKPCFDPVNYTPMYDLDTLELMYKRLSQLSGDSKHLEILQQLQFLNDNKLKFENLFIKDKLREILEAEDSHLSAFYEIKNKH